MDTTFDLGVFQAGRIELVENFADFDHNGDGRVDDDDLLFAVTLRSGIPGPQPAARRLRQHATSPFFVQDDWRVTPELTLNLGLRWEMDTDVKNVSGFGDTNPLVRALLRGRPRAATWTTSGRASGFNWTAPSGRLSVHGGWGIYYDRVTLEIASLEKGLDGRALPVEVRAGNVFFLDPETGRFPPFAPSLANPFTGFVLPGAGASGINIIDNGLETPEVQQWNLGAEVQLRGGLYLRADGLYNRGTHFIIGRTLGTVFNPVVGGPDRVVNLESSVGHALQGPADVAGEAQRTASLPGLVHAGARRTTTRTTTRSRSRTARSIRTIWSGSSGRAPTTAGTASRSRAPSSCRPASGWRRSVTLVDRRAHGHPDARRQHPRARAPAQRGRTPSSTPAPS